MCWYDERYPYTETQPKFTWSAGLAGPIIYNVDWRIGYIDFGKHEIDAIGLSDDSNPMRTVTSRFISRTHLKGWYLSAQPGFNALGIRFFGEVGLIATKANWDLRMENMPTGYYSDGTPYGSNTVTVSVKRDRFDANTFYRIGGSNQKRTVSMSLNYYTFGQKASPEDNYILPVKASVGGMMDVRF